MNNKQNSWRRTKEEQTELDVLSLILVNGICSCFVFFLFMVSTVSTVSHAQASLEHHVAGEHGELARETDLSENAIIVLLLI